ncbi:MAG: GNAT family N-acetyltransferase, partial [Eubacterium sp.]|nr:GNAT family N-acetyltransferase [Eubacterium sp.]
MIKKAQKEDLEKILELQYLAYRSEAKLFGNMDIPPLKQTIEEVYDEFHKGTILKAVDD